MVTILFLSIGLLLIFVTGLILIKFIDKIDEQTKKQELYKKIILYKNCDNEEELRNIKELINYYIARYPDNNNKINQLYDEVTQKLIDIKIKKKAYDLEKYKIFNTKIDCMYLTILEINKNAQIKNNKDNKYISYSFNKNHNDSLNDILLTDKSVIQIIDGIKAYNYSLYHIAIDNFLTVLTSNKNTPPIINAYLGASYFYQNPENPDNINKAESRCIKALNEDITIDIAHFILAKIYMSKNRIDEAINELKNTIEINSNFYNASFELAKIYFIKHEYEKAESLFKTVLKLKPDHLECLIYLGEIKMNQGKFQDSLEHFIRTYNSSSGNLKIILNIAHVYSILEKYNESILYYQKALEIQIQYETYFYLAECYEIKEKFEEAKANYFKSIKNNKSETEDAKIFELKSYKRIVAIYEACDDIINISNIITKLIQQNKYPNYTKRLIEKFNLKN